MDRGEISHGETPIFLGTYQDNVSDMIQKGRNRSCGQRGQSHWGAVLTNAQALEIRRRRAAGEKCSVLAREFGVSIGTISGIGLGKIYRI